MIYLDHTATKMIPEAVLQEYIGLLREYNYNPAGRYQASRQLADLVRQVKADILHLLGADQARLIVTSGATESINTALKGMAKAYPRRPRRIITTDLEHSATRESLKSLEKEGFEIVWIKSHYGQLDWSSLEAALSEPALAISLIHVQNEFGLVLPVEEIVKLARSRQAQIKIHLDAVQSIGRLNFDFKQLDIDAASFSCHKFGAPKGIGYLVCKSNLSLEPLLHGGGQQDNYRSGTENYPLLAASLKALELTLEKLESDCSLVDQLKQFFLAQLDLNSVDYRQIKIQVPTVPNILALEFPGLRAEPLMTALSQAGICVSIGSACSSKHGPETSMYESFDLDHEASKHVLRFSLNSCNTKAELSQTALRIKEILDQFRV